MAASLVAAAGCATNPVTGERELSLISESQEIEMGRQAAQEAAASLGLVQDSALQAYVSGIGQRLAADSERPHLPWSFAVVDDPTPNAFALPGGFIFVTRGLLSLMDSEAELASVLGHEIGHVTARHSVSQISRAQLAQLGLGLGTIFVPELAQLGDLASAGLGLLFLKYGRDDERQADELGFRYALTEGYDVRDMVDVFAALQAAGELAGQSALPAWLSTHPYPEERIQRIQERLATLEQPLTGTTSGRQEFLQRVDGLVYGDNPRNGYFDGSTFLHPDLRFRLELPQGWPHQNLAQAVVAVSPQQDAAVQLTLAEGADPVAAGRAFLSQQGIQSREAGRATINGLTAYAAYFSARTQQGDVAGLVTFIGHEGRTYQILTYAPSGRARAYDATFQAVARSFAPLTDRQALNVQPRRLELVRLPSAMTLAEFQRRYPSPIPIEELALINQVAGADAVLPAGSLAKRVREGGG